MKNYSPQRIALLASFIWPLLALSSALPLAAADDVTVRFPSIGKSSKSVATNGSYTAWGDAANDSVSIYNAVLKKSRSIDFDVPGVLFGYALAMRGNELLVGIPGANFGTGQVNVYDVRNGKLIDSIVGTGGGWALGFCLAADGDLIVIGEPAYGGFDRGRVSVIRAPVGNFRKRRSTVFLEASDAQDGAFFGRSVAVHGSTIAVGAPYHDNPGLLNSGKAYVFDASDTATTPVEVANYVDGAVLANANYGWAVALSPHHLIATSPFVNANAGAAFWRNLVTGWQLRVDGRGTDQLGYSASSNGSFVALGAPGSRFFKSVLSNYENVGSVYVFTEPGGVPTASPLYEVRTPTPYDDGARFGEAVSLFGDSVALSSNISQAMVVTGLSHRTGDRLVVEYYQGESLVGDHRPGSGYIPNLAISAISQASITNQDAHREYNGLVVTPVSASARPPSASLLMAPIYDYPTSLDVPFFGVVNQKAVDPVCNTDNYAGLKQILSTPRGRFSAFVSFSLADGTNSVLFPDAELSSVKLKALGDPRHGPINVPGIEYFVVPSTFQTKTGGLPVGKADDSGIVIFDPLMHEQLLLREGTTIDPGTGLLMGQFSGRLAFERRNLVFSHALQGAASTAFDTALTAYHPENGSYLHIAQEDDGAAGTSGARYSTFLGEMCNGFGPNSEVLFRASLRGSGVTAANNEGLWATLSGGAPTLISRKNDVVPGTGSARIKRFLRYWIDDGGNVYVQCQLTGTGVSAKNDIALVQYPLGGVARVQLREGSPAPGLGAAIIGSFSFLDGRENGVWVALVTLVNQSGGASASNNQALYSFTRNTNVSPVVYHPILGLRKGDRVQRTGLEVIRSIRLANKVEDGRSGALAVGMGHVLGKQRNIATIVTFEDRRQAMMTVHNR